MSDPDFLTLDEVLGIHADSDALYDLVDGIARSEVDKSQAAVFLKKACFER